MKYSLLIFILSAGCFTQSALANSTTSRSEPVVSCDRDASTLNRIESEIAISDRISVYNSRGEVVGAFDQTAATGDLAALYLCGNNAGYYYAEGNLRNREISSIYNDEYEVNFKLSSGSRGLSIKMTISFVGEPEDADYAEFDTEIFVKIP